MFVILATVVPGEIPVPETFIPTAIDPNSAFDVTFLSLLTTVQTMSIFVRSFQNRNRRPSLFPESCDVITAPGLTAPWDCAENGVTTTSDLASSHAGIGMQQSAESLGDAWPPIV